MTTNITWVDVPDYEQYYEISSAGQVRTKFREIKNTDGEVMTIVEPKLLEIRKDSETQKSVVFLHDGSKYTKHFLEDLMKQSFR